MLSFLNNNELTLYPRQEGGQGMRGVTLFYSAEKNIYMAYYLVQNLVDVK